MSIRILRSLEKAGVFVPNDPNANLAEYGMDSLRAALSVLELEREFGQKLKLPESIRETFQSVCSIQRWIESQVSA